MHVEVKLLDILFVIICTFADGVSKLWPLLPQPRPTVWGKQLSLSIAFNQDLVHYILQEERTGSSGLLQLLATCVVHSAFVMLSIAFVML